MSAETRGMTLKEYCIRSRRAELLQQWHYAKNDGLTPDAVTCHSRQKVWWIDRLGHEWQQEIYSRTALCRGCPFCAGREVLAGFNDLASTHPALSAQWDWEKNFDLTPQMVMVGNSRKVWWRCEKGHSWQATIASRASGCGCPVCANRKILPGFNDFATTHPALAAEWHPTKNGDLTPQKISYGYDKKVWWLCANGHEWQAAPKTRVRMGAGCPICANDVAQAGYNDLATLFPTVAAEWHPTKNGNLTPSQVVSGSHQTVWWRCSLGHEWRAEIVDRTRGTNGCPYCGNKKVLAGFNDLASIEPEIAAEWHPTLNGALTPEMVTAGSNRKVWWLCPDGHVWRTAISNRTNAKKRTGCPVCAGNVSQKHRHLHLSPQADAERRRTRDRVSLTIAGSTTKKRCCANGTRRETLRSRRRRSPTAVIRRSGGVAKTDTSGKLWFIREPTAADVRSAPEKRHKQASTIWQRSIRSWRGSGIIRRIFLYYRQMLQPAAIG